MTNLIFKHFDPTIFRKACPCVHQMNHLRKVCCEPNWGKFQQAFFPLFILFIEKTYLRF